MRSLSCFLVAAGLLSTSAANASATGTPTIAILPLRNLTGERNSVGAAFRETLTADLRETPGVRVVERALIDRILREQSIDPTPDANVQGAAGSKMGTLLGASHLIAGAYQRQGSSLRVTARIISVATGQIVGASKVDGDVEAMLELQDKVSDALLASVGWKTPSSGAHLAHRAKPRPRVASRAIELFGDAQLETEPKKRLALLKEASERSPDFHYARDAYRQQVVQEDIVSKIDVACDTHLQFERDDASLRANNLDITRDQTDGYLECNEPLRLIWYACQSERGKSAVKAAKIRKVTCAGVSGPRGSLKIRDGVVTVERSFEELREEKPYVRSQKQFSSALGVPVLPKVANPYEDLDWKDLQFKPNPVTNKSDYCTVNGAKQPLDLRASDPFELRKEDATIKCYKSGELVVDLTVKKGKKTGTAVETFMNGSGIASYKDGNKHGVQRFVDKRTSIERTDFYDNGAKVWSKQAQPNGTVVDYSRGQRDEMMYLRVGKSGHVTDLRCTPQAKEDPVMKPWCGFAGSRTVDIYDGTGAIVRTETWKNGLLEKSSSGPPER